MLKLGITSMFLLSMAVAVTGSVVVFLAAKSLFHSKKEPLAVRHELSVIPILRDGKISCSSVVISDTTAITAKHCVVKEFGGATLFGSVPEVLFRSVKLLGPKGKIKAKVYAQHSMMIDLAILKGDFRDVPKTITLGSSSLIDHYHPTSFDSFQSCGFPLGLSKVHCAAHFKVANTGNYIESRGALFNGMSGGPLLLLSNGKAYVVGITSNIHNVSLNTYFSPLLSAQQLEEYFKVKL